jgi:radical SAM superfamily enzyme YgiQ (UPF0313 family)
MRLYLINPSNPLVSILNVEESRWNRYRVWKPLGLMVIAGLTPQDWEVTIIDENLGVPDYSRLPRPDLVGITAFTSQAERAYELATRFRDTAVPVVIGGIHATMCLEEASVHVDTVVTGEAERVWAEVLEDARAGHLKPLYEGGFADLAEMSPARHDLLPQKYVRLRSDNAWMPTALQLLQCDGVQRIALPPTPDQRCHRRARNRLGRPRLDCR